MTADVSPDILDLEAVFPPDEGKRPSKAGAVRRAKQPDPAEELRRAKLRQLQEYLRESLAHPDPEVAMLGTTNADLFRLSIHLSDVIENVLEASSSTAADFETLMRGTAIMLKLTRQIDRFTQLRLVITESRSALQSGARSRKSLQ